MEGFYKKFLIYVTILILASMITLFTFDSCQTIIIVTFLLIFISYTFILAIDRLSTVNLTFIHYCGINNTVSMQYNYCMLS